MSTTYGLTSTGFVGKPAPQSKADFDAAFKAIFGDSVGSNSDGSIPAATSLGQEVAVLVDSESTAWEMLSAIYASTDPNQASGAQLDVLCALTGTKRKSATYSVASVTAYGTAGTTLPVGRVVSTSDTGTRFDTTSAVTLAAVANAWAQSTTYAAGYLVNANGKIWQCITAGTSAGVGTGPSGTGSQTDGTAVWYAICAAGLAVGIVSVQAEQTGTLGAASGTLTVISTPVAGWSGVVNPVAATPGTALETDAALRLRRVKELQIAGGGPPDAIRAAILTISGVEACVVFNNASDLTDAYGTPPHGVQVLILAPTVDDQTLAYAVWSSVGAGTATGNALGTPVAELITDASGYPQIVKFSRPTPVAISVKADVYYDPTKWQVPSPSAAVIAAAQSAIITFAASYYQIGYDVRATPLAAAITDGPQATQTTTGGTIVPLIAPAGSSAAPGIVDVLNLQMKRGANPFSSSAITIGDGEIAAFDAANITITAISESP
jgi:uncharacterized phage protein gp47/JayE